ncbi:MAG TPA: flippase [Hymenobacter sp.]
MSIARNTLFNLLGALVPVVVSIITIPVYLSVIGLDRFGVLSLCLLLVGYFNFFEFGLGPATSQKLATLHEASPDTRSNLFWTALTMSAALATVASLAVIPIVHVGVEYLNTAPNIREEVKYTSILLALTLAFGIMQSILSGALSGRQDFLRLNTIMSLGNVATAVFPLLTAISFSSNIYYLIGALLLARLIVLGLLLWACINVVPIYSFRLSSRKEVRGMLQFGGWTTVTGVINPILVYLDRFAIGAVISSAAVALYTIPFSLVSQLSVIPAALASALMPRLAAATNQEAAQLSFRAVQTLLVIVTPLTILVVGVSGPFLGMWIGTTSEASVPVAHLLLFGFWVNSLARVPLVRLQARGRPDILAKLHVAEIIPYLVLLYACMRAFGLPGAAFAWSVRTMIDAVALFILNRPVGIRLRTLVLHGAMVSCAIAIVLLRNGWEEILLMTGLLIVAGMISLHNMPSEVSAMIRGATAELVKRLRLPNSRR